MEMNDRHHRIQGLSSLIGNTPLFAIDLLFNGQERTIYAKAEHSNASALPAAIQTIV